jgi:septal ring factor EnvC (AmiA/AmiB activator)
MGYVVLTSSLTGLAYAVANAKHQRAELQAETARLDDRIAALRSDDRLAALAARLKMSEPQHFALVELPPAQEPAQARHIAAFSSLAGLLVPPVAQSR